MQETRSSPRRTTVAVARRLGNNEREPLYYVDRRDGGAFGASDCVGGHGLGDAQSAQRCSRLVEPRAEVLGGGVASVWHAQVQVTGVMLVFRLTRRFLHRPGSPRAPSFGATAASPRLESWRIGMYL